jgi:hypothetical protein
MTVKDEQKIAQKCAIRYLENPRLSGVLIGVDLTGEIARLNPSDFSCCSGTGLNLQADGSVYRCDLIKRLQAVQGILATFELVWGRPLVASLQTLQLTSEHTQWLADFAAGRVQKGRCLQASRDRSQPGVLWAIALAGAWRFGLRTHVVTMGSTRPGGYFPKEPACDDQRKLIYLIERVDKLWTPERAFDFETLVGWCDRAETPLWLEVLVEEKKVVRAGAETARAGQYSRKIADLKNKPALSWLQRDCASRLSAVTDGVAKFRLRSSTQNRPSI